MGRPRVLRPQLRRDSLGGQRPPMPSQHSPTQSGASISPGRAVAVGHLVVTLPVLAIIAVISLLGWHRFGWGALVAGSVLAWPWWSVSVPRWRRWALAQGADPDAIQRLGELTGLVWPRGWIFEKTEIPPRQ